MAVIIHHATEEKIYLKFLADTLDEVKAIVHETITEDLWSKSYDKDGLYFIEVGPMVDNYYADHFSEKVSEALGKLVAS